MEAVDRFKDVAFLVTAQAVMLEVINCLDPEQASDGVECVEPQAPLAESKIGEGPEAAVHEEIHEHDVAKQPVAAGESDAFDFAVPRRHMCTVDGLANVVIKALVLCRANGVHVSRNVLVVSFDVLGAEM